AGSLVPGTLHRSRTLDCIGTSSILCGSSCFRCSISSTGILLVRRKNMSEYHDPSNVTNPEHADHHIVTPKVYGIVFDTLLIGTAITVAAAFKDLGIFNPVVALAIACTKAVIVI